MQIKKFFQEASIALVALAIGALFSLPAFAVGQVTGTVTEWDAMGGYLLVKTTGTATGQPNSGGCISGANPGRFAVPMNTDTGKAHIATLLAARTMGWTITIVGSGTCTVNAGDENLAYIVML